MKKIEKNKWGKLILFATIVGFTVTIISTFIPKTISSFNTIYVDRQAEAKNPDYFTYEGIYSQQTAERFTDTIKGLLLSDNLIGETLEASGIQNTKENRKLFAKDLTVKKTGPQVLNVRIKGAYYKETDALISELEKYVNEINTQTQKGIVIKTVSKKAVVEENKRYPILNGLVSALIILFIGGILLERKSLIKKLT